MTPQKRGQDAGGAWIVWAVVGAVTLVACVLVVVLVGGGKDDGPPPPEDIDARALYEQHCANCHAVDGSGAVGPAINDGRVEEKYPDVADQIEVVAGGRVDLGMPPFAQTLSEAEIEAVVDYTRGL